MKTLPLPLAVALLLLFPLLVEAQMATVVAEENVRADPNGIIIGQLHQGTPVRVVESADGWSRITFEGVVWIPSLQTRDGGEFDLIVSAEEGENLRAEPQGRIIGHLGSGTLLVERGRTPGWVEVERTAWIWSASIESTGEPAAAPEPAAESPSVPDTPADDRWIRAGAGGSAVLTAPDGDTLGMASAGRELQVLNREGNWARVRIDGWVWAPEEREEDDEEVVLRGVSADDLAAEPERFRGRVVELELQFISLERAEAVRADFQSGEPFLLTRTSEPSRTFVYVAIPASELEDAQRLSPLARIVVVGRVRTGAAALTGNPVLDLLEMRTVRE